MSAAERLISGLIALMGLFGLVRNKRFADSSERASANQFGIPLRPGTRAYRFNRVFSRTMAIVVGSLMLVAGMLGVFGVDWRDVYR